MCMLLKIGQGSVYVGETVDKHRVVLHKWVNEWLLRKHLHELREHPEKFDETPAHGIPILELDRD